MQKIMMVKNFAYVMMIKMNELKTLTDLREEVSFKGDTVYVYKLRQEAIKWFKELTPTCEWCGQKNWEFEKINISPKPLIESEYLVCKNCKNRDISNKDIYDIKDLLFIKHFFNITEQVNKNGQ